MQKILARYKYLFLVYLGYLIGFIIIQPFGEFPLNDDWSYTWSVQKFVEEGKIDIGSWPAMTLATHILWGSLFVKVFGFSFTVLRLSTWVSVFIGMFFFEKLLYRISNSRQVAAIGVFTMLFNPIYFNGSHSFMTDVNFFTLLVISINIGFDFFQRPRMLPFILVFVFGFALMMVRQYGIMVPGCMTVTCFFLREKRIQYSVLSIVFFAAAYYGFLMYEEYLRSILLPYAAYKYTGNINPARQLFWTSLAYGIETRHRIIAIHALFHTLPLTLLFIPAIFRRHRLFAGIISAFVVLLVYRLYKDYPLQVGNVFDEAGVGADTTYETLKGTYHQFPHFRNDTVMNVLDFCKFLFISISSVVFLFFLRKTMDDYGRELFKKQPTKVIFLVGLFLAYLILILITESFFDRYQVPVIGISIALFAYCCRVYKPSIKLFVIPAVLWYYVSVCGTHDYFKWNDLKWQAYYDLQKTEKVPPQKIHGGFEITSWNDGQATAFSNFMFLHVYDYLIQFQKEDSFAVLKEYPYRRYYPYMMDTVRVLKRNVKPAGTE